MKEWYLVNKTPNVTSGYEDDIISQYAQSNFEDVLSTIFSDKVMLYNSDLTIGNSMQCVIQNNTSDTQLKSLERTFLFPIGTIKAGMYIFFEGSYWLVTGYPGNNKVYEKVTAILCQYLLKWQNAKGDIISRWVHHTSAAKYDVGENGNKTIIVSTNTFTILIPNDDESLELEGKRVFIDKRVKDPTKVYKITRNDSTIFDYSTRGGILNLIADEVALNYETDNQELRICNYLSPTSPSDPTDPEPNPDLSGNITYKGSNQIIAGGSAKTFTFIPQDKDGNEIEYSDFKWKWNISDLFRSCVTESISTDNKLKLKISYSELITGEKILISVLDRNGVIVASLSLEIGGGL